jgi:hypothetical protein
VEGEGMTVTDLDSRNMKKETLLRELERLRRENELLRARTFRPLPKTAARYLRILAKVYGPEAWTTPMCVHLVAQQLIADYKAQAPSTGAIAALKERGYIERRGGALRITADGMGDEVAAVGEAS